MINIDDIDRKIMKLRALGYRQEPIAGILHTSQPAISQRIENIRKLTKGVKDTNKLFWKLMLGDNIINSLREFFK